MINHSFALSFQELHPKAVPGSKMKPILWVIEHRLENMPARTWLACDVFANDWHGRYSKEDIPTFEMLSTIGYSIAPLLSDFRTTFLEIQDMIQVYSPLKTMPLSIRRHIYLNTWREHQIKKTVQYLIERVKDPLFLETTSPDEWHDTARNFLPATQETWRAEFETNPKLVQLLDAEHQDDQVRELILQYYPELAIWLLPKDSPTIEE